MGKKAWESRRHVISGHCLSAVIARGNNCSNSLGDLQYSFSLTTFSPSGKLVQIEYALNAVAAGTTSLGIKATNGVVIATEKKLRSALVDETTVQRISTLTPNIGVAYSGMGPDSRVLVRKARKQAQAYYQLYKEQIPVAQLCREVATVMQEFTRRLLGVDLTSISLPLYCQEALHNIYCHEPFPNC